MAHTRKLQDILSGQHRPAGPVIAVVSGSGQVARCAVQGGADLLIVLSAGFFRHIGAGSLASLMPYSNANEVTTRLLREQVLPCRGGTPVVAGVLATDPAHPVEEMLEQFRALGVDGVTNWPAAGFFDGSARQLLEAEGAGVEAEVDLLRKAREHGLAAFGFALEAEAAQRFAETGAEALILDMGLTRRLEDVREHRDKLQQAIVQLQEMLAAVRRTGRQPLLLGFGGPVTTAEDLEQVLRQCDIGGFAGGSLFERLPVQEAVTATVRRFKGAGGRAEADDSSVQLGELIGTGAAMRQVFQLIRRVAPFDVNVSIEGETGTGKELVAALLHQHSARSHGPFITLNCGAISDTLLESELFGHEKGAFTGAYRRRLGKFELADRGTLFLDEIGDLSQHAQVALLRAIQQREITRVGGETTIPVDTRIVTASHKSLPQLVREEKFRSDLYFRLSHIAIQLPPLRERLEDIPLLARAILARLRSQLNRPLHSVSERFLEKLALHAWPGNVRELEHVIRQAALLEDTPALTGRFFHPVTDGGAARPAAEKTTGVLRSRRSRSQLAREAIQQAAGNKSQAAAALGITRKTLYSWLKK
jgi:two-component system response regulator HydG